MKTIEHIARQLTTATEQNLIKSWNARLVTDSNILYYTKPQHLVRNGSKKPADYDLSIWFHKTTPSKTIQALMNLLHDKYGCTLIKMPTDDMITMKVPQS